DPSPWRRERRSERDDAPDQHCRDKGQGRRNAEQRMRRITRLGLLLHEILHAVRGRLEPAAPSTDAIGAMTALNPGGDLSFGEGEQCRRQHVDREDDDQLDDREHDVGGVARDRRLPIDHLEQRVHWNHFAPPETTRPRMPSASYVMPAKAGTSDAIAANTSLAR